MRFMPQSSVMSAIVILDRGFRASSFFSDAARARLVSWDIRLPPFTGPVYHMARIRETPVLAAPFRKRRRGCGAPFLGCAGVRARARIFLKKLLTMQAAGAIIISVAESDRYADVAE